MRGAVEGLSKESNCVRLPSEANKNENLEEAQMKDPNPGTAFIMSQNFYESVWDWSDDVGISESGSFTNLSLQTNIEDSLHLVERVSEVGK